jgi:hypothetical protein
MLRIENKLTGCMVETPIKNWRRCLNCAKMFTDEYIENPCFVKSSDFILSLKNGYNDEIFNAYIV